MDKAIDLAGHAIRHCWSVVVVRLHLLVSRIRWTAGILVGSRTDYRGQVHHPAPKGEAMNTREMIEEFAEAWAFDETKYPDNVLPGELTMAPAKRRFREAQTEARGRLTRMLRKSKAEAWSEGYYACHQDYQRKAGPMLTPNPHSDLEDG